MRLIAGLLQPDQGEVIKKSAKVGYVSQRSSLLPFRTVWQNVALPLEIQNHKFNGGQVDETLKKLDLWEFRDFYPYQLQQKTLLVQRLSKAL